MSKEQLEETIYELAEKFMAGKEDKADAGFEFMDTLLNVMTSPRLDADFGLGAHDAM